jgi:uncharacterized protein (DUF924 family)
VNESSKAILDFCFKQASHKKRFCKNKAFDKKYKIDFSMIIKKQLKIIVINGRIILTNV